MSGAMVELATTLHAVIHGPLNPLKFCADSIYQEFEKLGICECADLITVNEALVVASMTVGGGSNHLEDFFPFDPLHGFRHTAAVVQPYYQEWTPRLVGERGSNVSEISC